VLIYTHYLHFVDLLPAGPGGASICYYWIERAKIPGNVKFTPGNEVGEPHAQYFEAGKVQAMTAARHTSQDFVAFLEGLVKRTAWARQIHVVLDNLSAHKTKDVERFLEAHPKVRFHFTPTYSSWLNQVELWFAKIQRDVIARGVFTSV